MWEYIINFINIIFSFLTNFSDDMAIIYMIKYFCGREIEINKKTWLICLGYETIVFILIKANIISESLIQNIIVILFILIYTYRLKFYKKLFSSFMVFIVNFTFGITLLMVGSALFSQQLFTDEQGIIEGNVEIVLNLLAIICNTIIITYIVRKIKENIYISFTKLDIIIISPVLLISFVILCVMELLKDKVIFDKVSDQYIVMLFGICGIIMNISIVVSLIKSKSAYYYKSMNEINTHYMEMQLKHFEAYKNSQKETRRIKHDMKNHIICISELLDKNKIEEVKKYVNELKENITSIDNNFKTGNIVLDSIINEKYSYMKQQNIDLKIEGYMYDEDTIQPVDICTIFANAIDNAIEGALKEDNKNKRFINIFIKENKNFVFTKIINNMVMVEGNTKFNTTKDDEINHGFGIYNIKHAVEKYKGNVEIEAKDNMFMLDIVLPK